MTDWPGFEELAPFFRIIDEGLSGLVDGEHFFDTLAEDAVFEYVISVPGYPRRIVGREAVAELYSGYGETMVLHASDELAVHRDREASVVVLEYAVHGRAVSTGHAYDNHFVSVITIKDRKITRWRDYLDLYSTLSAGQRTISENEEAERPTLTIASGARYRRRDRELRGRWCATKAEGGIDVKSRPRRGPEPVAGASLGAELRTWPTLTPGAVLCRNRGPPRIDTPAPIISVANPRAAEIDLLGTRAHRLSRRKPRVRYP